MFSHSKREIKRENGLDAVVFITRILPLTPPSCEQTHKHGEKDMGRERGAHTHTYSCLGKSRDDYNDGGGGGGDEEENTKRRSFCAQIQGQLMYQTAKKTHTKFIRPAIMSYVFVCACSVCGFHAIFIHTEHVYLHTHIIYSLKDCSS